MAVNEYDKGDQVKVTGTFTNAAGAATDPTNVFFQFKKPDGTITTYEYITDPELVKQDTGIYYVLLNLDSDIGAWHYRWYSTGTGKAANEHRLIVKHSRF